MSETHHQRVPSQVEYDDDAMPLSQQSELSMPSSASLLGAGAGNFVSTDSSSNDDDAQRDEAASITNLTVSSRFGGSTEKKCIELLNYIAVSEETTKSAKNCFCKDFDLPDELRTNHFSKADNQAKECKVLTTSYEVSHTAEKLGWKDTIPTASTDGNDNDIWIKIPCPQTTSGVKPEVTDETDGDIRAYLAHIRDLPENVDRFQGCKDLNDMLPFLTSKDIQNVQDIAEAQPEAEEGWKKIRALISGAVEHSNSEISKTIVPLYQHLHVLCNSDMTTSELIAGLCHVRLVYNIKKGEEELTRIVNGPLLEVPMQVKLHRGGNGAVELWVSPAEGAKVALNMEVLSSIIAGGGGNSHYIDELHHLAETTDVSSISLANTKSFEEFQLTARDLSCRGKVKQQNDPNVHVIDDIKAMLITDGWCLIKRNKKSTAFSVDARNLMHSFKQKKLEISNPLRAILEGPQYVKAPIDGDSKRKAIEYGLVFPLPTSESQKLAATKLLVENEPVFILEGPPGTGKTHSIVNIAATALSVGKTVIVTSSNPRALQAFREKLPPKLRALALDMSCCKLDEILDFQQALEGLCKNLLQMPPPARSGTKLENYIMKKKEELKTQLCQIQTTNEAKRELMDNEALTDAFELASKLSVKASWFLKLVWGQCLELDGSDMLMGTLEKLQDAESVSFGGDATIFDNDDFVNLVKKKAKETPATKSVASTFRLQSMMTESEKKLSLVRVGGKTPCAPAEWQCVLAAIEFRKACAEPLRESGCKEDEFYSETGPVFLRDGFSTLLKDGLKLKAAIEPLSNDLKKALHSTVHGSQSGRAMQDMCRTLAHEIHKLEGELLFSKVVVSLKEKLTDTSMSKLKQLHIAATKLKTRNMATATSPNDRSNRHLDEFMEKFKETAKFMPFLIMTLDQISAYLPPDHSWDLGIIDETSQSNCTAINFIARCNQLLAVGDDKQVSPSQVALGEERIRSLKTMLPGFPTASQLLPEYSFFDLCQATFPKCSGLLSEHYRSVPEIISISNDLWYFSELNPLRLAGGSSAILDKQVKGKFEKGKNEAESEWISDHICDSIRAGAEEDTYQTIGVISMGGPGQCKRIKQMIEEKTDSIIEEFGDDVVRRHKILVGTPKEFQGDERCVIYLSLVYSPNIGKKGDTQKISAETGDSWKSWNVALTRAQDKMIVCRSYSIKDLKTSDVRQKILRKISKPWKGPQEEKSLVVESFPLVEKMESALKAALEGKGYQVEKNQGCVWNETICVDSRALICLENAGESKEEWEMMVDQQRSLEGAGRPCLRVDCLELICDFPRALEDVLGFLSEAGLSKTAGVAKKPRAKYVEN